MLDRLPNIKFWLSLNFIFRKIVENYGTKNSLVYRISNAPWASTQNFDIKRVQTFKRNVQNIIAVALDHNICPIIVNWECDWESDLEIPYFISSDNKYLSNKLKKYLHANNMALKELAEEKKIHFIESGPFSSDCFSDKIHFNGKGLKNIADKVSDNIIDLVQSMILLNKD